MYSYQRRLADSDPISGKLVTFERIVDVLAEEKAKGRNPDSWTDQVMVGAAVRGMFAEAKRRNIHALFLGILQNYRMDTKERRVIERAAKTFSKTMVNRIRPEKAFEAYAKAVSEWKLFLDVAKRVVSGGLKHDEEGGTVLTAGSFTLINTGGFDEATMATVGKLVEKAEHLLTRKGLRKVCYGAIQVTNTIQQSTRVLAFYLPSKDEVFIRANLKGKLDSALKSTLHELAHRLHSKFLSSKDNELKALYRRIKDQEDSVARDRANWPPVGSEVKGSKGTYRVTGYKLDRKYDWVLELENLTTPGARASWPLKGYLGATGMTPFVSLYAATSYGENFAEMIAMYCLDDLPADQVTALEALL